MKYEIIDIYNFTKIQYTTIYNFREHIHIIHELKSHNINQFYFSSARPLYHIACIRGYIVIARDEAQFPIWLTIGDIYIRRHHPMSVFMG